jgi:pilus assembly protein CpaB
MKTKSMVLLAMALGCGLVAMLGVQQILSGEHKTRDTVPVLVAKQEIGMGKKLDPSQVAFEDWPRENVPAGAVTNAAQYEERALKVHAYPGDVILQAKLGAKGEYGASTSIRPGMRVVTVPVNMTSVHSGMIRPGDRVDVLCTYVNRRPGSGEFSRTKTVLEYIEVFAIDRNREGEGSESGKGAKAENLSVLVTPEQAHVLMLASSKGKLQMALRNMEDKDQAKAVAVDDNLFDELQATKGKENENAEPAPKPVEEAKKPDPDFKKFLETASSAPGQTEATEEVWAIEIFEGDTKRVETIKRPILKGGATAPPVAEPAAQSPTDKPAVGAA